MVKIAGYSDRLSVRPGETLRVMVSATVARYDAEVVRLVGAETARDGSGFEERRVENVPVTRHSGRVQSFRLGSFGRVASAPPLRLPERFSFQAWILPTLPAAGPQAIVSQGDPVGDGWSLAVEPAEGLVLTFGGRRVSTGIPVAGGRWSFVAASIDGAASGEVLLAQWPTPAWPVEHLKATTRAALERPVPSSGGDLLFAARVAGSGTEAHFNGRLDRPRLFAGSLSERQLAALFADEAHDGIGVPLLAAWDFSRDIPTDRICDVGPNALHGRLHQMPTRAVTDHTWDGSVHDWTADATAYGAIHFHADDLEDAGWEPDIEIRLPEDLPSGIYAAKLTGEGAEDHVPFFVRPPAGEATNRLLFLQSTNTHLAYANWHVLFEPEVARRRGYPIPYPLGPEQRYGIEQGLLSLYDHHADGSGVCYSSRLRPIMNMRPKMNDQTSQDGLGYAHGLKADLHVAGWLTAKGIGYDVATDEDLHAGGVTLLSRYRAVVTGTHPEYWTGAMLDAAEAYQRRGGRFIYLGGNGFYWVTSFDPEQPHVIEVRRSNGSRAWSANVGEYHHSTTGEAGGLWRERGFAPQRLTGVGFAGQGADRAQPYCRTAASYDPRAAWIFEGVTSDVIGDAGLVMDGAGGFEIDRADVALGTPPHALVVASATGFSDQYQHAVEEVAMSTSLQGGTVEPRVRADMVFYETPEGGAVFSVGSIAWGGALPLHGSENDVSRVTENVVRRFIAD